MRRHLGLERQQIVWGGEEVEKVLRREQGWRQCVGSTQTIITPGCLALMPAQ